VALPADIALSPDVIAYSSMSSPLGTLWLAAGDRGLVGVSSFVDELSFCLEMERLTRKTPQWTPEALSDVVKQLEDYFAGCRRVFDLELDLSGCTAFQRAVLGAVRNVPYGAVASYQDIAKMIGKPRAMRAVGGAVAMNPVSLVVPCHRIIRSDGTPGEYAVHTLGRRGVRYKVLLLALEGVELRDRGLLEP
jgi:methylated-DNA-[protein]-cysteine S-methyltransferase